MESMLNATAAPPAAPSLRIFRGGGALGQYASSPFVTKLEFRLRLAGQSYSVDEGAPWLGPKGKIPYVEIQSAAFATQELVASTKLGDSALIIKHLVESNGLKDLNADLSPAGKAQDLALRALLEDKLYFMQVELRGSLHRSITDMICASAGSTTTMSSETKLWPLCRFQ
ncbi:hypothetical protein MBLNU459_g3280t2 [Dothideomycetes sp. NU459]